MRAPDVADHGVTLAVITVTWNAGDVIEACLAAVLGAGAAGANLEVIVVDNASSDDTRDRVRAAAARDGRIRLVESGRNAGFAVASNLGARASRCPFALFLNPDVTLESGALEALLETARRDPAIGVVGAALNDEHGVPWLASGPLPGLAREAIDKVRHALRGKWGASPAPGAQDELAPHDVGWVTGACLLLRRDVLDRDGPFDESFFLYFEDKDLCKRVAERGFRVVVAPGARGLHLGGSSSRKAPERPAIAYRESQLRYYRKHRSAAELMLVRGALTALFLLRLFAALFLPARTSYTPRLALRLMGVLWRRGTLPPIVSDPGGAT